MSATPKVSVITPAYKAARYIGQAIESVQAQTLTDWEMIIVDDASPDETAEVVKHYLDDPRIRMLRNEQNRGAGYSRNRALDAAQGEWIAVLDADDWFASQRLERLVRFAEEWDAQMVTDFMAHVTEEGTVLCTGWSSEGFNPKKPRVYTAAEVIIAHPAFQPIILKHFLDEKHIRYREHLRVSEDYAFQVEILMKGARFAVLPEPMYWYRIHKGSLIHTNLGSQTYERLSCEYLCSLPECTPRLRELLWYNVRRGEMIIKYPSFVTALKSARWGEAWRLFREEPMLLVYFARNLPAAIQRRLFRRHSLAETLRNE